MWSNSWDNKDKKYKCGSARIGRGLEGSHTSRPRSDLGSVNKRAWALNSAKGYRLVLCPCLVTVGMRIQEVGLTDVPGLLGHVIKTVIKRHQVSNFNKKLQVTRRN